MTNACEWCPGGCGGIELSPVLGGHLNWLWQQLADVGDRRGDVDLARGSATVKAPPDPTERAAAIGLLGGRTLSSGQTIRIDLADLAARLRKHHPALTPGMIAAHGARRRLGARAQAKVDRRAALERLRQHVFDVFAALPDTAPVRPDMHMVWPVLQRSGWAARLLAEEDPGNVIAAAAGIIAALPPTGQRRDRRLLADEVTHWPHALDAGILPALVLAILVGSKTIPSGGSNRVAWAAVGVDCDDLTGGLLALGIYPAGWSLPHHATVTIPPRELVRCDWPRPPHPDASVYVTENPSVTAAAAELAWERPAAEQPIRLLCTVGTPSAREIDAIARLADVGWRIAVRADFDEAGLQHVSALLSGIPGARPWRMGAVDYLVSLTRIVAADRTSLRGSAVPATPWDPELQQDMTERGVAAYEETLIDVLLEDLSGKPTDS